MQRVVGHGEADAGKPHPHQGREAEHDQRRVATRKDERVGHQGEREQCRTLHGHARAAFVREPALGEVGRDPGLDRFDEAGGVTGGEGDAREGGGGLH